MVALACGVAGASQSEPDVPTFDLPVYFDAPWSPGPLAATPSGYDLVGASGSNDPNDPDGFAEIAVAGNELDDAGWIWIYRNNSTTSDPDISLTPLLTINVFSAVGVSYASDNAYITDIAFANLTDGDMDPDLVVAVSYQDPEDNGVYLGKVATFRSERTLGVLSYIFVDYVDLDYPVTGLTVGAYGTDGRQHVLAACEDSYASGSAPSRVFVLQNSYDATVAPNYGKLIHISDLATSPIGTNPTRSVVAGQFSQITGGGMGGGGSGNTLDFAAFGAGTDGITLGIGNGSGAFTFGVNPVLGAACNGSGTIGFGDGIATSSGFSGIAPIVDFDPFSNYRRSLATTDGLGVSLIHYDNRYGSFSHLCDGQNSLDYYVMEPLACEEPEPLLVGAVTDVARGHFNDDTYEDLVYVDPTWNNPLDAAFAAFLLGRGAPGGDGRIMLFDNCVGSGHFVAYESTENGGHDHVLSVNLNNDGFDEVLITRSLTYELIVLKNTTGN